MPHKDPEVHKAYQRAKGYGKKRYHANKERMQALALKWKLDNPSRAKYIEYKGVARYRRLPFRVTYDEFMTFWQVPCSYCGDSIDSIGLDRVDNDIGYVMSNLVSCCIVCNSIKGDHSYDEFIEHCHKVSEHSKRKGSDHCKKIIERQACA